MKRAYKKRVGVIPSDNTRRKMRNAKLKNPTKYWLGKKRDPEMIEKMRNGLRGNKNAWDGGKSTLNHLIRNSVEYKLWRTAVFQRDNHTCRFCGIRGGKLNADHIKPFALFPELRFAIDNGRTLCEMCHRSTETFGVRMKKYDK